MNINHKIKKFNKTRDRIYRTSLCHAPNNSITFEPLGYVKNCCLSHEPIGKYPNSRIVNMINCDTNIGIKYNLDKMMFPLNCKDCKIMLSIGNFNNTMIHLYDNPDFIDNQGIVDIAFSLENTCNLKCIMCNSYKSSRHANNNITKGYYGLDFLKEIEPLLLNIKSANFTGGEPFLIEIYYKIWNFIIEHNPTCKISITTNGTILNEEIKKIISQGNFNINVSLDTIDPKLYEKIRVGASFKAVEDNLYYFTKYSQEKGNSLNLSICPMQINIETLPNIGNYAKEHHLGFYLNTIIAPYEQALWSLENSQFKNIIKILTDKNPFNKKDQAYEEYVELIKNLKKWAKRDQILAKQKNIESEIFLKKFHEILIAKNVNEEKANLMSKAIMDFDEKYYTEQLIQQFITLSDYYIDILNSPLIENQTYSFLISNYIYYSIFT